MLIQEESVATVYLRGGELRQGSLIERLPGFWILTKMALFRSRSLKVKKSTSPDRWKGLAESSCSGLGVGRRDPGWRLKPALPAFNASGDPVSSWPPVTHSRSKWQVLTQIQLCLKSAHGSSCSISITSVV